MKKLTRLKCLSSLILALAAALSLTACSADTASGVFPELSQIVGEIIQTAEESSPVTREFFQTQEPEEQPAKPERPDVPQTPGEGQEGFPQTDEESVQPEAPPESSPVTREFFQTQEPEEQPAKPERPDVPQTSGEGQVGFPQTDEEPVQPDAPTESSIAEDGSYTTKEDVALYIHTYGKLPQNFITKKQARELGWGGGSLEPYAPGMCIGGDRFGNYEGLLPEGHSYTECDVNTLGASSRGAERIVFSSDGLIYYTGDHYASFTLLYGEE